MRGLTFGIKSRRAGILFWLLLAPFIGWHGGQSVSAARTSQHHGDAAGSGNAILRRSMSVMRRSMRTSHGSGTVDAAACCPRVSGVLHMTGDCTAGPAFSARFTEQGTAVHNTAAVHLNNRVIVKVAGGGLHAWVRSLAQGSTWRRASARDWEDASPLCPAILLESWSQHFPSPLANVGSATVDGASAWHLHYRVGNRTSGPDAMVLQLDIFVAKSTLYVRRYESLTIEGRFHQRLALDFSQFNMPVRITAPRVGATAP